MSERTRVNSNVACGCRPTAVLCNQHWYSPFWIAKYQEVNIPGDLYIADKGQNKDGTGSGYVKFWSIDEYWHNVMQLTDLRGGPKYPWLEVVVKMILSLSHGHWTTSCRKKFERRQRSTRWRSLLSEKMLCARPTHTGVLINVTKTLPNKKLQQHWQLALGKCKAATEDLAE